MAFMTYEESTFEGLQDQPTLRAVFNLARQLHEDMALERDKRAEELKQKHPEGTPIANDRPAFERMFARWMSSQAMLTSLPDLSEDIKARTVIVNLLEGTYLMAHNNHEGPDFIYKDMRAAIAASPSSAFFDTVITEMEENKLASEDSAPSVAQAEYLIIDTKHTIEAAQNYLSRGAAFKTLERDTLHPKEYINWTNTIESFDRRGADGIPPSLYAQAETAVNALRVMKTQFKPA